MSHSLRYSFGVSSSLNAVVTITLLIVIGIVISGIQAQENAQTRIPISLAECYENPAIYERDNRLPATINTLIELIRKIEDTPGYTQDLRQVVTSILHRFRLDGIERAPGVFQQSVLPFSPSGYQFSKHRLLLSRLIPGNAFNFPNNTLTTVERVSFCLINGGSGVINYRCVDVTFITFRFWPLLDYHRKPFTLFLLFYTISVIVHTSFSHIYVN